MIAWLKSLFEYRAINIGDIYLHGMSWIIQDAESEIEIFNISKCGKYVDIGDSGSDSGHCKVPVSFIFNTCTYLRNNNEH